jgi:hypothetical protein
MSDSKIDLIYDLVKSLDQKQDQQSERLTRLESNVERNTQDLSEHIEGVKQTRILIAQNDEQMDERVKKLEHPKDLVMLAVKMCGGIGVVISLVYGVLKIIEHFK